MTETDKYVIINSLITAFILKKGADADMAGKRFVKGNSKAKPIIIAAAAVVVILVIILAYLAIKANEDNRIAQLRYNFNRYYPDTFNTIEELDPKADYDADGYSNESEAGGKTNLVSADTDGDCIVDFDEEKYGTDPSVKDCDGDGIPDGVEILAGLSPVNLITDGETKDADRKFTRTISFSEGLLTVSGDANIYGATLDKMSLNAVTSNAGALTAPYEFYCSTPFESASVAFRYDTAFLTAAGLETGDLKVFKFNPYLKEYNAIGGAPDGMGSIVCDITENGVYLLGASKVIHQAAEAYDSSQMNVCMLIDNSGSMYSKSVQSSSKESDVHFKRCVFAQNFVTAHDNSVKFSISVFTYDFKNICSFESDKSRIINAINSIRTLGAGFDGTSVERALMLGLESFGEETLAERNVIILLTDGISTDTAGYTLRDIVTLAKAKNVTIMTIGLGNDVDTELLQKIAVTTGGKYYPISEANILEGLYSTMIASLEDDIVDDDFDGTPDSYTLYDTGFDADFNGYSFNNFKSITNNTLDFGMIMLARDWFRNVVPNSGGDEKANTKFTFDGTTISTAEPLRKVVLQSMQSQWLRPDTYLNFLSGGDKLQAFSNEKLAARETGWSVLNIPYSEGGMGWTQAEMIVPDYRSHDLGLKYSENDFAMIRAIHAYDALRDTGDSFILSSEKDLNNVKSVLDTGTPLITKLLWENADGTCSSRYVLMTTLRRDLENPNIFKIKIYDVNSDSQNTVILNRTVRITGSSNTDFTYSAEWNGKKVSLTCYLTEMS